MERPAKHVDNFGTYLKTVQRPAKTAGIQVDVAPMKILESLNEHQSAVNVLQLAESSGLSISQTVMALQTLRDAQLVAMTGNDDAASLTPSGRTIASISIPGITRNGG